MTSFKRGYNVILRSCFHQNQRFALTTIVNCTFLGCVHAYFAKAFWNADVKTPIQNAVHGSTVHASLEKKTIRLPKKACLGILGMFNSGYCSSSSEPERRLIWRHLNVVIMWFCVHASTRISVICSNHVRKRTFLGVLNRRFETRLFENKHGRNSVLL